MPEADASNFKTANPNFREQVNAVARAEQVGLTVEEIATRLRKSPAEITALQDAARLGPGVIDRVTAEAVLGPFAAELGRGVRVYGIRPGDAAGWFRRIADAPKGQRPTQTAVRDTIDKFSRAMNKAPAEMFAGFDDLGGSRGGILELVDANARQRTALEAEARTRRRRGADRTRQPVSAGPAERPRDDLGRRSHSPPGESED